MPEPVKKKPCPMCGTDMPINGTCPNDECGFDDAEAERKAKGQVYINKRVREIEQEQADAEKKQKKAGKSKGFFS